MIIAATHSHNGAIYGAVLIALGIVHFVFREFFARRSQAFHDARQATAPSPTRRFYRNHDASWYRHSQYWASALFVVLGILDIALNS
jgi:hypothetical protein